LIICNYRERDEGVYLNENPLIISVNVSYLKK